MSNIPSPITSRLPIMLVDVPRYNEILQRGFARFPERAENYRKLQLKQFSPVCDQVPGKMYIEPVGRCNFRCIACDLSITEGGKRSDDMSLADLDKLLDQFYGLYEVILNGVGEGTLHRGIFDMIRKCADRDIWVLISTNGSLLHQREGYKRFIDSGVGEVVCSFDGSTKEVFERIRPGAKFDKLVQNFTLLNDYANSQGLLRTRSYTVVQTHNFHQLKDIIALAARIGFPRHSFGLGLFNWSNEGLNETIRQIGNYETFTDDYGFELIEHGKKHGIDVTFMWNNGRYTRETVCPFPFERAFIGSDKKIAPCCRVNPQAVDLGYADDFAAAWNADKFQEFRRQHLSGDIPKVCRLCYDLD